MSKNQHDLKAMQSRKTKLEVEIKNLEKDKKLINEEINKRRNSLNSIRQLIKNLTIMEIVVSEHAMLRYIERVMEIDLKDIKNRILTKENREIIDNCGSCTIKDDNIEIIVKNRCVISVLTRGEDK